MSKLVIQQSQNQAKTRNPGTSKELKTGYPEQNQELKIGYQEQNQELKTGYPEQNLALKMGYPEFQQHFEKKLLFRKSLKDFPIRKISQMFLSNHLLFTTVPYSG